MIFPGFELHVSGPCQPGTARRVVGLLGSGSASHLELLVSQLVHVFE